MDHDAVLDLHWTIGINAPVEQVFSYLRKPENMVRAQGGGDTRIEICDVKVTPDAVGSTGRSVFPSPGSVVSGSPGRWPTRSSRLFRTGVMKSSPSRGRVFKFTGTWTWTFEPENGGRS